VDKTLVAAWRVLSRARVGDTSGPNKTTMPPPRPLLHRSGPTGVDCPSSTS